MDVRDAVTAKAHLLVGAFVVEGMEFSMGMISTIALQLSQMPKLAKPAVEGFRALAFLIDEASQKQLMDTIAKQVEEALDSAMKNVKATLEENTNDLSAAAISVNNTIDEFRYECNRLTEELTEAATAVTESVEATASQNTQNVEAGRERGKSYADMARKAVPPMHAGMVAKGETQKRRVRLVKATGLETDGMAGLSERQLVEKANLALDMMEEQTEEKPNETRFVGATKLRGAAGGAIYEMNSEEAAEWLKGRRVMKAFIAKMGSL